VGNHGSLEYPVAHFMIFSPDTENGGFNLCVERNSELVGVRPNNQITVFGTIKDDATGSKDEIDLSDTRQGLTWWDELFKRHHGGCFSRFYGR
jgi:hypothetical protein